MASDLDDIRNEINSRITDAVTEVMEEHAVEVLDELLANIDDEDLDGLAEKFCADSDSEIDQAFRAGWQACRDELERLIDNAKYLL